MVWKNDYKNDLEATGVSISFWENFVVPSVKKIKGEKCQKCGSKKRLIVHHKRYDRQTIDDFELLCFICHMKEHKKK